MFELDDKKYPKKWKEMSFDFKLFFIYHGCMMILFMTEGTLPIEGLISVVAILLLVFISLSIQYRKKSKWHWPGVGDLFFRGRNSTHFTV